MLDISSVSVKKASLADPWSYIPICVFLYKDSTTIASQREIPDLDMCLQLNAVVACDSTVASLQVILRAASD